MARGHNVVSRSARLWSCHYIKDPEDRSPGVRKPLGGTRTPSTHVVPSGIGLRRTDQVWSEGIAGSGFLGKEGNAIPATKTSNGFRCNSKSRLWTRSFQSDACVFGKHRLCRVMAFGFVFSRNPLRCISSLDPLHTASIPAPFELFGSQFLALSRWT